MITDLSYKEVMAFLHPYHQKWNDYCTSEEDAMMMLRFYNYKVRKRYIKDFTTLTHPAILFLDFSTSNESIQHVAIWDPERKKVLEPHKKSQYMTTDTYKACLEYVWIIT
jgi:hypothetical protein